jgi:hypothetical protein
MDGRQPSQNSTPERGSFKNGVGRFTGDYLHDGTTWETNWISELTRKA